MGVIRPRKLVPGSHVRILSPSGPVTEALLEPAVTTLTRWGLEVSLDETVFARDRYLAGDDASRHRALQQALDAPDVDAVIFSRGGYGAMRILDALDWSSLRARPRILCGFSDITALHLSALRHAEVATLHGHVAKSFATQQVDLEALRSTLFGERGEITVAVTAIGKGRASGPMIGGNLSLLAALASSRHLPSLDGAILFLEDVGEPDYRLDRLFTCLRLSDAFSGVAGIVLGDFSDCAGTYVEEAHMRDFVGQLARDLAEQWQIPVVCDYPAGHDARNLPIPFGLRATVDGDNGTVIFHEEFAV